MELFETTNEQAVIGAMLVDSKDEITPYCMKMLMESDFHDNLCRSMFPAIKKLYEERKPHDLMTVSACGLDIADVAVLASKGFTSTARHHAMMVKTNSLRRTVIQLAHEIELRMGETGAFGSPDEVVDYVKAKLDISLPKIEKKPENMVAILDEVTTEIEKLHKGLAKPMKYGIGKLDMVSGGIWPAELTIIAAGPGMGKSAFAISTAFNLARAGKKVHVCTLEMNRSQTVKRLMSRSGFITGDELKEFPQSEERKNVLWGKIIEAQTAIQNLPITVDETSRTIQELANKVTNMREAGNIDLLIVDYLQLLGSTKKHESRRHEIEFISRQLKLLSRDLSIPVFALSQLSREGQKNTKPRLFDLRESGAIEQDADNVIFLWDNESEKHLSHDFVDMNLILAKQRSGKTGELNVKFHRTGMTFTGVC